jgi:hypothetical protein
MALFFVLYGFLAYSVIIFIISTVLAFFKRSSFLLKLNAKYLGIIILLSIIVNFFGGLKSIRSDEDLLYMFTGIPLGIVFCVFVNKTGFDLTKINRYVTKSSGEKTRYSLKKDYFQSVKTGILYLFVSGILWFIGYGQTQVLAVSLIMIGALHAVFFDKRWALCPYCEHKIREIRYNNKASVRCPTCRSIAVIHGNELARAKGRAH